MIFLQNLDPGQIEPRLPFAGLTCYAKHHCGCDKECAKITNKLKAVRARRIRVLQQIETIDGCIKLMVGVLLAEIRRFSGIQEQLGNLPHEERKAEAS